MRRTSAALTSAALLTSLAITAAPGAAAAATNTLTVTVIDRTGAKVRERVVATNLGTKRTYDLIGSKAASLPRGTYVVTTLIREDGSVAQTVGARTVKVSGASATTVDARKGRPVKVALDTPKGAATWVTAAICVAGQDWTGRAAAVTDPGHVYVVPNSSANLRFAYMAEWSQGSEDQKGRRVVNSHVVAGSTKGVPAGVNRTFATSKLARLTTQVRTGATRGRHTPTSLENEAGGCLGTMRSQLWYDGGPVTLHTHVSPGKWQTEVRNEDGSGIYGAYRRTRTMESGKTYSEAVFPAVFGPSGRIPVVNNKLLRFSAWEYFVSPAGYDNGGAAVVKLTKGGKVLKQQTRRTGAEFNYRMTSAGWYGLTVDAKRTSPGATYPGTLLSARTISKFRFYANPNKGQHVPAHTVTIAPKHLDITNSAAPGSTTKVEFTVRRQHSGFDVPLTRSTVKSVIAYVSVDHGKTWKKATLSKSGGKWVTSVKNPGSGYVSLRTKVTDTKGNSSETIVYRAYRIG
ncbi:hypothetical protein [Melissospora conviva]|uniref:hypothetical protein n=1 Tax=Melissospora conviva TaxID=3388432 RepID=UPI003C27271A